MERLKDYRIKESHIIGDPHILQLRTEGKDRPMACLSELQEYANIFNMLPHASAISIPQTGFDGRAFVPFMKELGWFLFKSYNVIDSAVGDIYPLGQLWVNEKDKLILAVSLNVIDQSSMGFWTDPKYNMESTPDRGLTDVIDYSEDDPDSLKNLKHLTLTDITVLHPPVWDSDYSEDIIVNLSKKFIVLKRDKNVKPKIGVISMSGGEYYVKDFSLENKLPIMQEMDLHYGDGFTDFHESLINRLETNTKGLILFHGEPGTGKTQYIRHLLGELSKINKSVIYFSPAMASQITSPDMMSFLSSHMAEQQRDCIILIEDAEPLLENRNSGDRTEGITNLLNMTDGILNDMLGVTVIATFNIDIAKIDTALLRPERLVARKWFSKVDWTNGEKLLKFLGMGKRDDITWPATIADIYSKKKENEILYHGVKENKSVGFGYSQKG